MVSWKLSAVALVLFSAVMASTIAKLEASFNVVAAQAVMVTKYNYATAGPGLVAMAADEKTDKVDKNVDILRDSFLLSWIIGGCIPGACVGIWIRALTKMVEIAKTFGVSLFTSFCAAPYVIKNYFSASPETCLLIGFLMAVGAWVSWEVALAIASRIKAAAIKSGWLGVKQEIFGGQAVVTQEQQPTKVLPGSGMKQ